MSNGIWGVGHFRRRYCPEGLSVSPGEEYSGTFCTIPHQTDDRPAYLGNSPPSFEKSMTGHSRNWYKANSIEFTTPLRLPAGKFTSNGDELCRTTQRVILRSKAIASWPSVDWWHASPQFWTMCASLEFGEETLFDHSYGSARHHCPRVRKSCQEIGICTPHHGLGPV